MQLMKVSEAMRPLPANIASARPLEDLVGQLVTGDGVRPAAANGEHTSASHKPQVQAVFADETLEQALRQLVIYGHRGLPVLARDGRTIQGWITNRDVLRAFATRLGQTIEEAEIGARVAEWASGQPHAEAHQPRNPLLGYRLLDLDLGENAKPRQVRDIRWPDSTLLVAVRRNRNSFTATGSTELRPGDRVTLLAPAEHTDDLLKSVLTGGSGEAQAGITSVSR